MFVLFVWLKHFQYSNFFHICLFFSFFLFNRQCPVCVKIKWKCGWRKTWNGQLVWMAWPLSRPAVRLFCPDPKDWPFCGLFFMTTPPAPKQALFIVFYKKWMDILVLEVCWLLGHSSCTACSTELWAGTLIAKLRLTKSGTKKKKIIIIIRREVIIFFSKSKKKKKKSKRILSENDKICQ